MNARSIDDLYDFVEKKKALPSPLFFHGLCREVKELERQITELQKKCRAADELAEFYGDFERQGGKRARVFLSKYPRETTSAQDAR